MAEAPDDDIAKLAAALKSGSVVAPAGCGKTEQIARATLIGNGPRLILTHTYSGIDALRARLKKHDVPSDRFRLDTIAGWCLRYAASFPQRSGLANFQPQADNDWNAVYESAARVVGSGAVKGILESSYSGVFVDEYQDCSFLQHCVVKAISGTLPVCVFGDPMQAIFDFKGQQPVDWDTGVFPVFPKAGELVKPWRWHKAGNKGLADWLAALRPSLETGGDIDLSGRPGSVKWEELPIDPRFRSAKITEVCKRALADLNGATLVVIADAANTNGRAAIAKNLAKIGFSNIEPLGCTALYGAASKIEKASGFARLEAAMQFICDCMTGAEQADFLRGVKSRQDGGRSGTAKFGRLVDIGLEIIRIPEDQLLLDLMQEFYRKDETYCFRREMFFAMRDALRIKCARQSCTFRDAIWEVQNRIRHAGRIIGSKSIGSTLLVKGLEFDYAIVIHADNMTRKDWYVALTRATRGLTVISPSERFKPVA